MRDICCILGLAAVHVAAQDTVTHDLFENGLISTNLPLDQDDFGSDDPFRVIPTILHGGREEGTLLLKIEGAQLTYLISPSRGMNIVSINDKTDGTNLGWSNPVKEIVNPIYINQLARGGSGFLEGFNENIVRAGYGWVGHAGEDNGEMLTLHGLSSSLPAFPIRATYMSENHTMIISGDLHETAFKKTDFTIHTETHIGVGADNGRTWRMVDTVINNADYESEYMTLYHANFGPFVVEEGSKIYIPATEVAPFNDGKAADELATWDQIVGPTRDYDETVYNLKPLADENNMSYAMIVNKDENRALHITYDVSTLPVIAIWKNLDLESRGYVVALEPGTSYSYNRRFNREIGLVPKIPAKAAITHTVTYEYMVDSVQILEKMQRIKDLQGEVQLNLRKEPYSDESISQEAAGSILPRSIMLVGLSVLTAVEFLR